MAGRRARLRPRPAPGCWRHARLNKCATCPGSAGAAIVTTARASGMRPAAASTAAPPRLCPIRIAGAMNFCAQMIGGRDQIRDIRGERGVCEFAFARAKSGEVEAQDGEAERGQAFGNAPRGLNVLAAGEAMGKKSIGPRLAGSDDPATRPGSDLRNSGIRNVRRPWRPLRGSRSPYRFCSQASVHVRLTIEDYRCPRKLPHRGLPFPSNRR